MKRYNPKDIEPKWQKKWEADGIYSVDFDSQKPKYVGFAMFNYPSGAGIHVGHVRNYTIPDVITRAKRQQGFETYQPVGWDSFGLPAENFAIKTGVSPQESTLKAIEKYRDQYRAMGWAVDWRKEINTTDPSYYKWTQWIFTKLFEHKLAYQHESAQWWCEQCMTVLADEQVIAGKCWRHDGDDDPLIGKKSLKQWFFKITDYAEEMLEATDDLDWTQSVKASQKSWIGKSIGAEVSFKIAGLNVTDGQDVQNGLADLDIQNGQNESIKVFTTRPDTLFGATFLVLAPENPLLEQITKAEQKQAVTDYQRATLQKSEVQRQQDADKVKTGVFTGGYATNPVNGERVPIWIADYVLMGYGTGAIMAVPGHDQRDYDFAQKFNLPITFVVEPNFGDAQGDDEQSEKIFAILRNPQTNEVVVLDWGPRQARHGGKMLIGGSVEAGEDYVTAATREIIEETGYHNFALVKEAEFKGHGYFYSNTKNKNYHASGKGLLFDLVDDQLAAQALDDGEKNKFTVTWQPVSKVADMLDDGVHEALFRYLIDTEVYHGEGVMTNSGVYDGLSSSQARDKIVADLSAKGLAQEKTNYKMRDWLISRQRYWGAPIPIIHCEKCGPVAVPEKDLPVLLPKIKNYKPTGGNASVLAGVEDWVNVPCPSCGGGGKRETDTMDGYVCSSWYFLRYLDPTNDSQAWATKRTEKWTPIDFYNGGDHATAHLLYARFFTRFFYQLGLCAVQEPFKRMVYNGKVKSSDGSPFSKSKGNGIDPLQIIKSGYGADAIRVYEMFAAPVELDVLWDEQGIPGSYRFLNRIWNITQEFIEATIVETTETTETPETAETHATHSTHEPLEKVETPETPPEAVKDLQKNVHRTIKKVTHDIAEHKFNTSIAAMMEAVNGLYKTKESYGVQQSEAWRFAVESIVQLVAPYAPHTAEELWQDLGYKDSVHVDHWPVWDDTLLADDTMAIAVQVNGKLRGEVIVSAGAGEEEVITAAKANQKVATYLGDHSVKKTIYVPKKLVSFVI